MVAELPYQKLLPLSSPYSCWGLPELIWQLQLSFDQI